MSMADEIGHGDVDSGRPSKSIATSDGASSIDAPVIRVGVLTPERGPPKARGTSNLLSENANTARSIVSPVSGAQIRNGALAELDVLYAPGGSVFQQQNDLGAEGRSILARWVLDGGGYVGICAGAFLAGQDGFDGANPGSGFLGASTQWSGWDKDEGRWFASVSLTPAGREILGAPKAGNDQGRTKSCPTDDDHIRIAFTGGSWHIPLPMHHRELNVSIEAFEPLLELSAINKRDGSSVSADAWGSASPAIAGRFGQGKVIVFGPHPESPYSDAEARPWLAKSIYWASAKGAFIS